MTRSNGQKTNLAAQLERRKTQIQLRKDNIGDAANAIITDHKNVQEQQKAQLERQKTLIMTRTKTMVRERTMVRREKTMVRDSQKTDGAEGTEKSQDFSQLDAERATQKAKELEEEFKNKAKVSDTEVDVKKDADQDKAYVDANKEPDFDLVESKLSRSQQASQKRRVKSEDAKKRALRRRVKSRARGSDSGSTTSEVESEGEAQEQPKLESTSRRSRKTFVDPDAAAPTSQDAEVKPALKSSLKNSEPVSSGRAPEGVVVEDEISKAPRPGKKGKGKKKK